MRGKNIFLSGVLVSAAAIFALSAPEARAAAEDETVVEAVDCIRGKDARRLEAQTHKTGCVLLYTKEKKTAEIAASRRGVELCQKNLVKVRDRLRTSGFECK